MTQPNQPDDQAQENSPGQAPNEHGVYSATKREEIARHHRSYAVVELCLCDDGLYRFGLHLSYSYGGFGTPILKHGTGFATESAAREAGTQALLQRFPTAWPGEPHSVHEELRLMKEQIERHLRQPSLF
jgi:hypothetical protein